MSTDFYDQASEALPQSNGSWVKLENVGDVVRGKLVDHTLRDNFAKDGKEIVFVLENNGALLNFPITQAYAKGAVADQRPPVGSYVEFIFTELGEAKKGMNPPKVITLTVSKEAPEWYSEEPLF